MFQSKSKNFRLMIASKFDCVAAHVKNLKPSTDEQEKALPWRQLQFNFKYFANPLVEFLDFSPNIKSTSKQSREKFQEKGFDTKIFEV